ncbi:MAG: hypothetical protein LUE26_07400, partial [Alistipes sp.]|nr:hypothetical protein [Alistipes sp.]
DLQTTKDLSFISGGSSFTASGMTTTTLIRSRPDYRAGPKFLFLSTGVQSKPGCINFAQRIA